MELLKLVIVDDEPILLQGLLDTYDWESMGFEVVGSAKSGVQALEVIRREQPHVVLTDIRMKQMTGLMVMEEIQKEQISSGKAMKKHKNYLELPVLPVPVRLQFQKI